MRRLSGSSVQRAVAFAVVLLLVSATGAGASHLGDGKKHRIVYQLDDPGVDKARFVLNTSGTRSTAWADGPTSRRSSWWSSVRR